MHWHLEFTLMGDILILSIIYVLSPLVKAITHLRMELRYSTYQMIGPTPIPRPCDSIRRKTVAYPAWVLKVKFFEAKVVVCSSRRDFSLWFNCLLSQKRLSLSVPGAIKVIFNITLPAQPNIRDHDNEPHLRDVDIMPSFRSISCINVWGVWMTPVGLAIMGHVLNSLGEAWISSAFPMVPPPCSTPSCQISQFYLAKFNLRRWGGRRAKISVWTVSGEPV